VVAAAIFQNTVMFRSQFPFPTTSANCLLAVHLLKVVLQSALLPVCSLTVVAVMRLLIRVPSVMNTQVIQM